MALDHLPRVTIRSRADLRAWLQENHQSTGSVWLVRYRKSTQPNLYVPYSEIVGEALCFGWIDSRTNRLDEERSMLLLAPRKPGSAWSKLNKQRVAKLNASGLMTTAGTLKVKQAKKDGSWKILDSVERLEDPADLQKALDALPEARSNFNDFPKWSKRFLLEWIRTAKRPETRAKRIAETASEAARNRRAGLSKGQDVAPAKTASRNTQPRK